MRTTLPAVVKSQIEVPSVAIPTGPSTGIRADGVTVRAGGNEALAEGLGLGLGLGSGGEADGWPVMPRLPCGRSTAPMTTTTARGTPPAPRPPLRAPTRPRPR